MLPARGVFHCMWLYALRPPHSKRLPARTRPAGRERRRDDRQAVAGTILICPGNEGALVNVSVGGFAVASSAGIRVGARYQLRWWTAGALRPVAAVARWSRLAATEQRANGDIAPLYQSGFELVTLIPDQTGVSCPASESPISTEPAKYSRQRSVTRREISSEQNSSSGKPGLVRASITTGMR